MATGETIEIRLRIAARPSTIFAFLSDPERFRQWIGAPGAFPQAAGDAFEIQFPTGDVATGRVLEIVPDRLIVFSWGYRGDRHGLAPESTTVSIELVPTHGATLLVLRHSGIPSAQRRREHAMGWRHYVSALGNAAAATAHVVESVVDTYHAAWQTTSETDRNALLARCWSPDGLFRDAMGYAEGREALSDHIAAAQRFAPNIRLERVTPVSCAHGFLHYRWRMTAADGSVVGVGANVGELASDGFLLSMTGFWESA